MKLPPDSPGSFCVRLSVDAALITDLHNFILPWLQHSDNHSYAAGRNLPLAALTGVLNDYKYVNHSVSDICVQPW